MLIQIFERRPSYNIIRQNKTTGYVFQCFLYHNYQVSLNIHYWFQNCVLFMYIHIWNADKLTDQYGRPSATVYISYSSSSLIRKYFECNHAMCWIIKDSNINTSPAFVIHSIQ